MGHNCMFIQAERSHHMKPREHAGVGCTSLEEGKGARP